MLFIPYMFKSNPGVDDLKCHHIVFLIFFTVNLNYYFCNVMQINET